MFYQLEIRCLPGTTYFSNSKTTSTSNAKNCPTAGEQKLQDKEQCFLKGNNSATQDGIENYKEANSLKTYGECVKKCVKFKNLKFDL